MNMNKALQNLYHAVSGSTTTKVNISKLLVDIHQAITGKESSNKNNWSRIINSMADNWSGGGGGGSSDFSAAEVTLICNAGAVSALMAIAKDAELPFIPTPQSDGGLDMQNGDEYTVTAILYKGVSHCYFDGALSAVGTGNVEIINDVEANITGDCTITIS